MHWRKVVVLRFHNLEKRERRRGRDQIRRYSKWRGDRYRWMRIVNIMDVWGKRREHVEGQGDEEERQKRQRERLGGNSVGATGTVNVGTGSATINIGCTAASTINIGNAGGIVNINKLRLSTSPVIGYFFDIGLTQILTNGSNTVKYPNAETRLGNGSGTGITYSPTTGIFTNSNSYSVVIVVSASVFFPANSVGSRTLSIITSYATVSFNQIIATSLPMALHSSAIVALNANETVLINVYQDSGGNLTIGGNNVNRVNLLVL